MKKYDRQQVKQITQQWVKENCRNITERDMGLLHLLYQNKRRLLRRDQVQRLYPKFASTNRLNTRLTTLFKMHIIDKAYPQVPLGQGTSQQHICLDRAGLILLGVDSYSKPINVDEFGTRSLYFGWEHKVMLNEYECNIRQFIGDIGAKIVEYDVEESNPYNDTEIIPDIFMMIIHNKIGYVMFIEADMGTENVPAIKKKIERYNAYALSRAWLNRSWTKRFTKPPFPRVIFLTEEGRIKRLQSIKQHINDAPMIKWHLGFHSQLNQILASIIKKD